eukprot:m.159260 g.159260  ORF g.159260 m.159260 type:complete len:404 (-) comp17606_c0_seq19:2556-3767(-)
MLAIARQFSRRRLQQRDDTLRRKKLAGVCVRAFSNEPVCQECLVVRHNFGRGASFMSHGAGLRSPVSPTKFAVAPPAGAVGGLYHYDRAGEDNERSNSDNDDDEVVASGQRLFSSGSEAEDEEVPTQPVVADDDSDNDNDNGSGDGDGNGGPSGPRKVDHSMGPPLSHRPARRPRAKRRRLHLRRARHADFPVGLHRGQPMALATVAQPMTTSAISAGHREARVRRRKRVRQNTLVALAADDADLRAERDAANHDWWPLMLSMAAANNNSITCATAPSRERSSLSDSDAGPGMSGAASEHAASPQRLKRSAMSTEDPTMFDEALQWRLRKCHRCQPKEADSTHPTPLSNNQHQTQAINQHNAQTFNKYSKTSTTTTTTGCLRAALLTSWTLSLPLLLMPRRLT